ncbi:gamma-glutamyltransferase [Saccharomonospora glauca]|jgi:gamma-glutamyltranspeptidase/glutathione hydrolase|uniref:Glutathione hydrolase proenzyme n=1 Tax=Saccharomonospora glauca K62 TaxID=928724 RepID=I1D0T1_9PSEU|nr:gamma-glutamyltransferase [Saccharomonospora glauca]EIE98555.1 gamma-glutamyltranspeptidase [Saccharomonospora glauca K62]
MSTSMRPRRYRVLAGLTAVGMTVSLAVFTQPEADARPWRVEKTAVAIGAGGAVSSVDPEATAVGIEVLRRGGNATDAAVATAAALGVTEPYSAGIGGGGFFLHYDAATGEIEAIDGRETAPEAMPSDAFIDPSTGQPYPFFPDMVTSGVSVGVPGTPATWQAALRKWGTYSLAEALRPAVRLARRGFVVDEEFRKQTLDNAERFSAITSTAELFLPGGKAPEVGSVFRNPDLARTYTELGRHGVEWFYEGPIAKEIAATVRKPPRSGRTDLPVPPGHLTVRDMARYAVARPEPTRHDYRGYEVVGMAPPSSGGTGVGEILNILEHFDLASMSTEEALHHYLEASALAYADRARYLGDPAFVDVPVEELLSDDFAAERACALDSNAAADKPVAAGDADGDYDPTCRQPGTHVVDRPDTEGLSTTHLSVVDRWGNVVAYTLTIEQTGGSGITVPGRGFLLNNELTDFSHVYDPEDPNRIEGGKRPRSSMSPTIVLRDGKPWLTLGSPGGSTIITTVTQILLHRIDGGMDLPAALAAGRATQRNTVTVSAEPAFQRDYGASLEKYGHRLSTTTEIGAAAAIEILPDGTLQAVAEPERRGGGAAGVVRPRS